MFFPLMATEVRVKTVLFWNGGLAGIQQVGELRNAQIPLPLKLRRFPSHVCRGQSENVLPPKNRGFAGIQEEVGEPGNAQILLRVTRFQPGILQHSCSIACLFSFFVFFLFSNGLWLPLKVLMSVTPRQNLQSIKVAPTNSKQVNQILWKRPEECEQEIWILGFGKKEIRNLSFCQEYHPSSISIFQIVFKVCWLVPRYP